MVEKANEFRLLVEETGRTIGRPRRKWDGFIWFRMEINRGLL
jgi:hypothetical protein